MADSKTMPICKVPCAPVKTEVDNLESCVLKKVPLRLFYWAIGGICFFMVVIIGGAQWTIVDRVANVDKNVAIASQAISSVKENLDSHIRLDQQRHERIDNDVKRFERQLHRDFRREND